MNSIQSVIYILLAACLLPYLFTFIAKISGGFTLKDNKNPRAFLSQTTGLAARANAVQQNSFESLPLFIAGVLIAEYLVVSAHIAYSLSLAYLVLRVLYGIAYLANWATLRSIFWAFSMLCPILLLLLAAKL